MLSTARPAIAALFLWLVVTACAPIPAEVISFQPGLSPEATSVLGSRPSPVPTALNAPTLTPTMTPTSTPTPYPTLVLPTPTPYPDAPSFSIGESWEGREITVWQFGDGPYTIVMVGGIHGGYEENTVRLAHMLVSHFEQNPQDVLPGIHLMIIPAANPDGLTRGDTLAGRLNAHGVDLNRNWGCEWQDRAFLRQTPVSPGTRPFSEAETLALRAFFIAVEPAAVIFYHSAIGAIFMGACGDSTPGEDWMPQALQNATGYPYYEEFGFYEVTGDATNWLAERGVPSAVVELDR